ncbi:hypothetical protein [Parvularcula sp. LCG005]|uniref:hypothetical protein n=1 Tax=Parvularcula sp. LCG005 TaxID=3078805 RepID=UPI0029420172|nr:hypothetical protein [Parvularcula sp. LCG005]WOI53540.1 hypothetical protein RUI03_00765 [Parvularcula sp. LCG005]
MMRSGFAVLVAILCALALVTDRAGVPAAKIVDVDRDSLMPVIRHRDEIGTDIITRPIGPALVAVLTTSVGEAETYLNEPSLSAEGLSADEAYEIAAANFREYIEGKLKLIDEAGFGTVTLDGRRETSLLVLDDFWEGLAVSTGASPIIVAPAREILFVSNAASPMAVDEIKAIGRSAHAAAQQPLSPDALIWRDGQWHASP